MSPEWALWLIIAGLAASGCARAASSCALGPQPAIQRLPVSWHLIDVTTLSQVQRMLSASPRAAEGDHPSDFFEPRDIAALSPAQLAIGPTPPDGPPQPPLTVTRLKHEGKTAGFFAQDARGRRYLCKLDLPAWPELLSGAEVASSKLLYVLGYHVPSYEILDARPEDFTMPAGAAGLDLVQALLRTRARGDRVRVSASRLLEGEVLGPLQFEYYRSCRALRALRLAYAWLNNTDAKDHNTLIVRQHGRPRAYLIDFGTSLGANANNGSKEFREGRLYDFELGDWLLDVLTLGLYHHWLDARGQPFSPAVGYFPDRFEPRRWKPYAPNLAFSAMTEEDATWMARRIASFSRAQLEAAIAAGRYSRPEDAAHLVEVLEARQTEIVKAYLR